MSCCWVKAICKPKSTGELHASGKLSNADSSENEEDTFKGEAKTPTRSFLLLLLLVMEVGVVLITSKNNSAFVLCEPLC